MNKAEVFEKEVNVSKKKNILFDMEKVFLEEELHKKDEKNMRKKNLPSHSFR